MSDVAHAGHLDLMAENTGSRPLVTFVLVAFNHERFVRQAIESALAQTYRPIQFIFSDDCSTDRTFDIMKEVAEQYEGKENIQLNRNEQNLGVVRHLNRVFTELSKGKYLIQLGGDDITTPDRTEKVVECFEKTGASAVAINPGMIDEEGKETGSRLFPSYPDGLLKFDDFFVKGAQFFGGDFSRDVFDVYGPMQSSARNEDRILPFRASTLGGVAYLNLPVYYYRTHQENMSFWIKKKNDPENRLRYEREGMRNELQNLVNFFQEVQRSYQRDAKEHILAQIRAKSIGQLIRLVTLTPAFTARLALVPLACRASRSARETLSMLMICAFPTIYLSLIASWQKFCKLSKAA